MADAKLFLIQRNMAAVCRRWLPFRPWRPVSWLSLGAEAFQLARGTARGQGGVVLRAKLAARRLASGAPAVSHAPGVRAWVGRKAGPPRPRP
jgi:hypothetical protein